MHRINRLGALCAALAVAGCATVTRGTSETFIVTTEPAGAQVRLSSGETCTTPCAIEKKRKHGFEVEIRHDGYQPVITSIIPQISGAGATGLAGNVLVGGLIGIGVDAATGAGKDLRPNPLSVVLVQLADTARETVEIPGAAIGLSLPSASAAATEASGDASTLPVDGSFED